MNYILISPLEHIAVAKIATTLWNQKEIRNLMEEFLSSMKNIFQRITLLNPASNKEWLIVEDNVRTKVHQLPLPELLKEKVLNAIKPVGCLIFKWMKCYDDAFFDIDLPKKFFWTSQGILDETETAKLLIKDKNINITRRYAISCIYCLEDNIKELWNELPEDNKNSICNGINQYELVRFWTHFINGWDFNTDYLLACQDACKYRNRAAAKYFFKKLHLFDRNNVLQSLAREMHNIFFTYNVVCFDIFLHDTALSLLPHASKEQQIEFFQMCPYGVLVCLLDWPWQSLFTKAVNYFKTCLPENRFDNNCYDFLLRKIIFKIMDGYKDFRYQNLLKEYWQQSSDEGKITFFSEYRIASLLTNLLAMKDRDNIKMILHDATTSEVLFRSRRDICKDIIEYEEWGLLKFFTQECVLSKIEMLKFKADMKKYMAYLSSKDIFERKIDKWNMFFSLLEEIDRESSK